MISVDAELLKALDAAPEVAQRQFRDRLAQLATIFPDTAESYLEDILSKVNGDLERAVTVMYAPGSPYHKKATAPPTTAERPPAPDFSYHGSPWLPGLTPSAPPTAPLPGPQARAPTVAIPAPFSPQLSPRAQALAEVIAAPTQPDREDTPMEEAAPAPDLVAPAPAPAPAEPESNPGSPVTPWHPTQDDVLAQQDAAYLRRMFPTISDEFVTQAIREGDGDPAAAIAWATAITDADRVIGIIADAFPTATPEEVNNTLLDKNGNAAAAYACLSRQHISTWDRGHTSVHTMLAGKLLPPTEAPAPEFRDRDPSYASHETRWWETMVATKAYKVAGSPQDAALWSDITLLATSRVDVTPRVAGYVDSLGAWYTDRSGFQEAMKRLQAFSDFGALTRYCTTNPKRRESALSIILALMEDGLPSPGAAAWAMQLLTRSTEAYNTGRFYFSAYAANRRILWNRRNQALAAWKATRDLPEAEIPIPGGTDASLASPPRSAHPRSLPGAAGWALPMSESTSKYVDLAVRPKIKQTRSASASGAGEPLEGQADPGLVHTKLPAPGTSRPTPKGVKKEAAATLRKKEREEKEARGEN